MTLFGLAALLAPVVGPTLGGWLTDQYDWRWVFLINVPFGLVAFARMLRRAARPGLSGERTCGAEATAVSFRRSRPDAARRRHGVLGSNAQQGPGMGLDGRPVLARADVSHSLCGGFARIDHLGIAQPQPRGQFPAVARTQFRWRAASLFFALMPCSTALRNLCPACCNRCSATTRWPQGWSCRRPASSLSSPCRSSAGCSASRPMPAG